MREPFLPLHALNRSTSTRLRPKSLARSLSIGQGGVPFLRREPVTPKAGGWMRGLARNTSPLHLVDQMFKTPDKVALTLLKLKLLSGHRASLNQHPVVLDDRCEGT
jgi:hypothetical protein